MAGIDLSILVCSTHTRWSGFGQEIQRQLWGQYEQLPENYQSRVEIIMLTDNKTMMLGHKRNVLVGMAQGRYVQFVDDDDRVEPDMIRTILDATYRGADTITFLAQVSLNGETPKPCRYSLRYLVDKNTAAGYERVPNHICAIKRDLATRVSFPHLPYGEDSGYAKLLRPFLRTETHIDRVLYHYDYSSETTGRRTGRDLARRNGRHNAVTGATTPRCMRRRGDARRIGRRGGGLGDASGELWKSPYESTAALRAPKRTRRRGRRAGACTRRRGRRAGACRAPQPSSPRSAASSLARASQRLAAAAAPPSPL